MKKVMSTNNNLAAYIQGVHNSQKKKYSLGQQKETLPKQIEYNLACFRKGFFGLIEHCENGKYKKFNTKQVECLKTLFAIAKESDRTAKVLYGGAKGGGKSYLMCATFVYMSLLYPQTRYFIARENLVDIQNSTLNTLDTLLRRMGLVKNKHYSMRLSPIIELTFSNGSTITFLYTHGNEQDHQRFGSMEFTAGGIEEAGEISQRGAYDNLCLTIGRHLNNQYGIKGFILLTANPNQNFLYGDFYEPYKNGVLPKEKAFIQAFATDNLENLGQIYVNELEAIQDKVLYERLALGLWDYAQDASCLFSVSTIKKLFHNPDFKNPSKNRYVTADIASTGEDLFVMVYWEGLLAKDVQIVEWNETNQIASILSAFVDKHKVPYNRVAYDSVGIGAALESNRRFESSYPLGKSAVNRRVLEFANGKSKEKYKDAKTAMYFCIKYGLESGINAIMVDNNAMPTKYRERLEKELRFVKDANFDKLGDKAERFVNHTHLRGQLGFSPDLTCAFIYRAFFIIAGL